MARPRSRIWASSITTNTSGNREARTGPSDGRGLFIAFEGIEGAGKSTQIGRVAGALREAGRDPIVAREPGGTPVGEAIREIVLDGHRRIDPATETLLILTARSAFVEEVVAPSLRAERLVLADRFALSTYAYQGGGRGLPMDELRRMNEFATRGLRPDLYVLLDIEPEDGLRRRGSEIGDRIESEGSDFHRRVTDSYRRLARSEPGVAVVDARGDVDEVFRALWAELSRRFPETFAPGSG